MLSLELSEKRSTEFGGERVVARMWLKELLGSFLDNVAVLDKVHPWRNLL